MSKRFLNALQNNTNYTLTENAAVARATTGSELLNFFSVAGALRSRSEGDIVRLFDNAWGEDPQYALKAAFYFRDIRGGQGERRTFRAILKYLASNPESKEWLRKNLHLVPEYGRWDDLFVLIDTEFEKDVFELIKKQLKADAKSENPSLLVKWLPSENASSDETKRRALKLIRYLGITPRTYRKSLSHCREKINVLERKLSAGEWKDVNYEHVPSQANLLYRKAFKRHDADRYAQFIELARQGKVEIKSGVLYPYDIVRKCNENDYDSEATLDALWKHLPDYCEGTKENAIVVADVSGSMYGLPICISVSLAIYLAERNKGVFHNKFITFSAKPTLQDVKGSTILKKVKNLNDAHWDMNTDVEAVFRLLLRTAVTNKISNDEMVKKLYIISDMEFDSACGRQDVTLFNKIREDYKKVGYDMPFLVFWNVSSRNDQFPMSMDDRGFLNVSGASPSIFKNLMKNQYKSAYDFMIDVLDSPRYEAVSFIRK